MLNVFISTSPTCVYIQPQNSAKFEYFETCSSNTLQTTHTCLFHSIQ